MIEMAVTMGVLGLLLATAMPSGASWIRNMRLRSTAESMQNGLQRARMEAIRRNTSVSFWMVSTPSSGALDSTCALSSTGASWVVSQDSPAGACAADPSKTTAPRIVISRSSAEGNAQSVSVVARQIDQSTAAQAVTFNGLGRVLTTAADGSVPIGVINFVVAASDTDSRALRIVVSSAGMIALCDPALAATAAGACPAPS